MEASKKDAHGKNKPDTVDFGKMMDKDLLGYIPVKLIPAITGLASILILTRNLVPEEYGTYSVVIATVLLLSQIFGTWLTTSVFYVYPDHQKNNDREFKLLTFKLQGVAAFIAVIIIYVSILTITHNHLLGLIGALMIVAQLFMSLMMTLLQSSRRVIDQAVSVSIQSLSQLAILCILIFLFKGKEAAALSAVLAGFLICIAVLFFKMDIAPAGKAADSHLAIGDVCKKLLMYGMPMSVWFFATQFYTIGDRILLKIMGTTTTLGQYAAFRDLATGCAGFLTMPLLLASHPIIMSMWKTGVEKSDIEKLMTRNLVVISILFVPILVAIDLCGPEFLLSIFGNRYALDKTTMLLVMFSILLGCLTMYVQKGLEVDGRTLQMALIAFFAAVLSLAGNMLAIPRYGVIGAAVVVVLIQSVYLIFIWCVTKNILKAIIPLPFLGKLALWVIGVELACRTIGMLAGDPGTFWTSSLFRFIFVSGATCVLFVLNSEVSSLFNATAKSFKKILT